DHHLAVGKLADDRAPERQIEVLRHLLREAGVGVAGEHHQSVKRRRIHSRVSHRRSSKQCWLGRKDSNPRMAESKSAALTSLATPQLIHFVSSQSGCCSNPRATKP